MRRTTYGTLVVLAILAGITWQGDRWFPRQSRTPKLTVMAESDIEKIHTQSLHGISWECHRTTDGLSWRMVKPAAWAVDHTTMAVLARSAGLLEYDRKIFEGVDRDVEYGLSSPEWKITIQSRNGDKKVFLIGSRTPDEKFSYLRVEGKPTVYTVPSWFVAGFAKRVEDIRSRELWKIHPSDVSKVLMKGKYAKSFERVSGERWLVNGRDGDAEKIGECVNSLTMLRVAAFPEDEPKSLGKYGLSSPKAEIQIWDARKKYLGILLVGNQSGFTYYVKVKGQKSIYEIESYMLDQLMKPAKDYLPSVSKTPS